MRELEFFEIVTCGALQPQKYSSFKECYDRFLFDQLLHVEFVILCDDFGDTVYTYVRYMYYKYFAREHQYQTSSGGLHENHD